jgi:hypothetical protein
LCQKIWSVTDWVNFHLRVFSKDIQLKSKG